MSRAVVDRAPTKDQVLGFVRVNGGSALCLYEVPSYSTKSSLEISATASKITTVHHIWRTRARRERQAHGPVHIWENHVSSITIPMLPKSRNATRTCLFKDHYGT